MVGEHGLGRAAREHAVGVGRERAGDDLAPRRRARGVDAREPAPHDARAGAHRRVAHEHRRAGHAARPADDQHAGLPLVRVGCAAGQPRRARRRRSTSAGVGRRRRRRCRCRRRTTSPGVRAAGLEHAGRACAPRSVTVRVGAHRRPDGRAGEAVDARRDVDRRPSVRASRRAASATHAASPSSAPRNPVPYIASTTTSARASARVERARGRSPPRARTTSTRTPQRREHARRDQTVAAVVALAADQHDPAPVGAAERRRAPPRRPPARPGP